VEFKQRLLAMEGVKTVLPIIDRYRAGRQTVVVRADAAFALPSMRHWNVLRRLVLPVAIQSWSLTSLQERLFKTAGRLIRHARYFVLQLAESDLTGDLFRQILGRIERLAWHPT
jgi:hypothetical protein